MLLLPLSVTMAATVSWYVSKVTMLCNSLISRFVQSETQGVEMNQLLIVKITFSKPRNLATSCCATGFVDTMASYKGRQCTGQVLLGLQYSKSGRARRN